ncbi:MAG: tRNA (adenosine(37)-N6)-dimethylallyltransferase MiaA [Acidobacteriota bacterium]
MENLLIIMGPTASGKSGLAVEVAERLNGEIISADAFAVYRGMDIGTDKPTIKDQRGIPHHLLDILDPIQPFSAGDFVSAADTAIAAILKRNRLPIVVGGTHFYIRSLLFGLFPSPPHDPDLRARLEHDWDQDSLAVFQKLATLDPEAAAQIGPTDRQRILRALEVRELSGEPISSHWLRHQKAFRYNALLTAPHRPRTELYAKINARVDEMFAGGLIEEVRRILDSGTPSDAHSLKAIGYREVVNMLSGRVHQEEAVESTKRSSRKLAKRQMTWLRGRWEGQLHWVPPLEQGGADNVCDLWSNFLETTPRARNETRTEIEENATDRQHRGGLT